MQAVSDASTLADCDVAYAWHWASLDNSHPPIISFRRHPYSLDQSPCCYRREGDSSRRPMQRQAGAHAFVALALTDPNLAPAHGTTGPPRARPLQERPMPRCFR